MLRECIIRMYRWLRLDTYRRVFGTVKERSGSLSATEAFSADVISLLNKPTLKQFADCIGISQPNATYKVNMLVEKGYVKKQIPNSDRREIHLEMAEKFYRYFGDCSDTFSRAVDALKEQFTDEQLKNAETVLTALLDNVEKER